MLHEVGVVHARDERVVREYVQLQLGVVRDALHHELAEGRASLAHTLLARRSEVFATAFLAAGFFAVFDAAFFAVVFFAALPALVFFTAVFFAADFFTTAIFPPYMPLQQRALLRYYHNYYNRICAFIINPRT